MRSKTDYVHFRVTPQMFGRLKELAKLKENSMGSIMRQALDRHLNPLEMQRPDKEFNPLLATLGVAYQNAQRAGYTKREMSDALGRFLKQLVNGGALDVKLAQELYEQAQEVRS